MKHRDFSLDLIRIIACLMVVTTHSPLPLPSADEHSVLLAGVSLFTIPCNALFFMVSGALLLPPPITHTPQCSTRAFLGKRLGKVVVPVLVWSVVYLVMLSLREHLGAADIARKVLSIPFAAQGCGVLWFMYTLIGLYLLTPILSAWLAGAGEKEERLYLGLWVITLCYPLLRYVVDINDSVTGILHNFSGCVGYFLLGHWLQHYGSKIRLWQATIGYAVAIGVPLATHLLHVDVDSSLFTCNTVLVFVLVQAVFWWTLLKTVAKRCHRLGKYQTAFAKVSALTFGIYLMHIFIMRTLLWPNPFVASLPPALQILVTVLLAFTIALALSWLISRTPVGGYVVGYRQRKTKKKT